MKKTCDGCKALSIIGFDINCYLGYKQNKDFKDVCGCSIPKASPAQDCPKPKTNKHLVILGIK